MGHDLVEASADMSAMSIWVVEPFISTTPRRALKVNFGICRTASKSTMVRQLKQELHRRFGSYRHSLKILRVKVLFAIANTYHSIRASTFDLASIHPCPMTATTKAQKKHERVVTGGTKPSVSSYATPGCMTWATMPN